MVLSIYGMSLVCFCIPSQGNKTQGIHQHRMKWNFMSDSFYYSHIELTKMFKKKVFIEFYTNFTAENLPMLERHLWRYRVTSMSQPIKNTFMHYFIAIFKKRD